MIQAAKTMAMTVVDLLAAPSNVLEAKREFDRQKKLQS
jgi:hypothetical protein